MKRKTIWLLLALMAVAASAWASMVTVIQGGSVGSAPSCSGCTSSTDTEFASAATTWADDNPLDAWFAWQFTTAGTKCITGIVCDIYYDPASSVTAEIYTDSSGSPGSRVGAGYTASVTTVHTEGKREFIFASTQTLAAGTYWAVVKSNGSHLWGRAASHSGTIKYSQNSGSTWTTTSWHIIMGVLGCDQS